MLNIVNFEVYEWRSYKAHLPTLHRIYKMFEWFHGIVMYLDMDGKERRLR